MTGSTPPAKSENKPAGLANTLAKHSFEGDGFWMAIKEEVAPTLTFGVDLDPILGTLDDIEEGPQNLDQSFTWEGLNNWLCKETAEIKKEGLMGDTSISCKVDSILLP